MLATTPHSILMIDSTPTFGGAFEQLLRVSEYLAEDKQFSLNVALAQISNDAFTRIPARINSYPYTARQRLRWPAIFKTRPLNYLPSLCDLMAREAPQLLALSRITQKTKPSIVYLNNLLNSQLPGLAAGLLRGAKCISCHQDFEFPSGLVKFAEKSVTHHVAISTTIEDHLIEFGIPKEKITLIHNCVDTETFSPGLHPVDLNTEFNIPRHKKVFAIFGRLVRWKGIHEFIKSARLVLDEYPDSHGLIVGSISDGNAKYEEELKNLVIKLGLSEDITFSGYRADIPRLMRSVDIIVHQSTKPEPFGLVVIEGMSTGKPVVAMQEGGPLDIITSGVDGLLAEPRNPEAVANRILDFMKDEDFSKRTGLAARNCVIEKFSAKVQARKYASLFNTVLDS